MFNSLKLLPAKLSLLLALLCLIVVPIHTAFAESGVNNFTISNYQIDYFLSKDNNNRSTLKTTETITAVFPSYDQNHGIERAIPDTFDGHSTSLSINSVTNANGDSLNYTTYDSNGNTVVRVGDANTYVHGIQTYKITYSQMDVTKYYPNTNDDEFYWDTNGTQWSVPISSLAINLKIDNSLTSALTGKKSCYMGVSGSTNKCTINNIDSEYNVNASNLEPGNNVTIAIGFQPHTFAQYKTPLALVIAFIYILVLFITLPIDAIILTIILIVSYRRANRKSEINTITPEYEPPKNASVAVSATIIHKPNLVLSAQLIDFAVRNYIKIYETQEKSTFKAANYDIEIVKDVSSLRPEEQDILKDIFGAPQVGARISMASLRTNSTLGITLLASEKNLKKELSTTYGLKAKDPSRTKLFKVISIIALIFAILTLSPWLLIIAITSYAIYKKMLPLTDSGIELVRYLKGLEMYIGIAEEERIKILQSPEGALKVAAPIDTNDKRQLVQLYEKVLPYAILFGQEKNWNKQLGVYYESINQSPNWYVGNNGLFNAVLFADAMNNFSSATNFVGASSSNVGGSGGGGFSGGGGGGGGGGGW